MGHIVQSQGCARAAATSLELLRCLQGMPVKTQASTCSPAGQWRTSLLLRLEVCHQSRSAQWSCLFSFVKQNTHAEAVQVLVPDSFLVSSDVQEAPHSAKASEIASGQEMQTQNS